MSLWILAFENVNKFVVFVFVDDGSGESDQLEDTTDIVDLPRQLSLQSQTGSANGPIDLSAIDVSY